MDPEACLWLLGLQANLEFLWFCLLVCLFFDTGSYCIPQISDKCWDYKCTPIHPALLTFFSTWKYVKPEIFSFISWKICELFKMFIFYDALIFGFKCVSLLKVHFPLDSLDKFVIGLDNIQLWPVFAWNYCNKFQI